MVVVVLLLSPLNQLDLVFLPPVDFICSVLSSFVLNILFRPFLWFCKFLVYFLTTLLITVEQNASECPQSCISIHKRLRDFTFSDKGRLGLKFDNLLRYFLIPARLVSHALCLA